MPVTLGKPGNFLPNPIPPSGGGTTGGGGQVTPPTTLTQTIPNIQALPATKWIQPGNAGDSGGSSGRTNGTWTYTPGIAPDYEATFSAQPGYPYNAGYWYTTLGKFDWANKWTYHLEVKFPTLADFTASQAIEFELQQDVNNYVFNMAWQADFRGVRKTWSTFDYAAKVWNSTGIPVDFNLFNHQQYCVMEAVYTRTLTTVTHVSLKINGQIYLINKTRTGVIRTLTPHTNAAFQLDSNYLGTPYIVRAKNFYVIAEQVVNT
jgi:hypothetical protein